MTSILRWGTPAAPKTHTAKGDGKWQLMAEEIRAKKNQGEEWALVAVVPDRAKSNYPAAALRKYGCDVTRRVRSDGSWEVWARCID